MEALLSVKNLCVDYITAGGTVKAVRDVSFDVYPGEILGIAGESGSGKSATAFAITRLLARNGKESGEILFEGQDVFKMAKKELAILRGEGIGMVFQDSLTCLDPMFTIGDQMTETLLAHEKIAKKTAYEKCVAELGEVGINDPGRVMKAYQHELSGGMRQRVMIAMALLSSPKLLIADEPTTALDVTIQEQILLLLKKLCNERGMSLLFVTHNWGIVADICDRVLVMYGGRIMEKGPTDDVFYKATHPYTKALLKAIPRIDADGSEKLESIKGEPFDPINVKGGCPFAPRCFHACACCAEELPPEIRISDGHSAFCHLSGKEGGAQ